MFNVTIAPDLQSRESVMAAAGRAQFAVTTADGVRYVKLEAMYKADGNPIASLRDGTDIENPRGKKYVRCTLEQASHVFVSETGYGSPRMGVYYPPTNRNPAGRFFLDDGRDAREPHVQAFTAVVALINGEPVDPDFADIEVESQCGLCGQPLRDPVSIERGIGPDCADKPTGSRILHMSRFANTVDDQEQLSVETTDGVHEATDAPRPKPDFTDEELRALAGACSVDIGETDGSVVLYEAMNKIRAYLGHAESPIPSHLR